MTTAIVTLTTDFGLSDEYVGALKGVLLSFLNSLTIIDISHTIPPQDILHASMVLAHSVPFFPQGTVHLAVVDPGVGSSRRIVAISTGGQLLVGPDNGLFTPFLRDDASLVHHVTNEDLFRKPVSPTFSWPGHHGPGGGAAGRRDGSPGRAAHSARKPHPAERIRRSVASATRSSARWLPETISAICAPISLKMRSGNLPGSGELPCVQVNFRSTDSIRSSDRQFRRN